MRIYSTWEILFVGLESKRNDMLGDHVTAGDAIEILKFFSFMNCQKIQVEILTKAGSITLLELSKESRNVDVQKESAKSQKYSLQFPSWNQIIRVLQMLRNIDILIGTPIILPKVLREFDVDRLRKALALLSSLGFITHHESSGTYSIHQLVHIWSRYRPEMTLSERAAWLQAAANTLALCVQIPLGTTAADVRVYLSLIPHI